MSAQTFEPWIGSSFRVALKDKAMGSITLIAVTEIPPASPGSGASQTARRITAPIAKASPAPEIATFKLQFSRTGTPLPQETYTLDHDWLGVMQLLLVPSGHPGQRSTCSAFFTFFKDA